MCNSKTFLVLSVIFTIELTLCRSSRLPCDNGGDPFYPDDVDDGPSRSRNYDFDHLVLSQLWSVTECIHWRLRNARHSCNMPRDPNIFTMHGLWPSQTGTNGPSYCPSNLAYTRAGLDPIINDLRERWTDIHAGGRPNDFWGHEWNKHGTCAQVLTPLNSVLKYFRKTLQFQQDYDIYDALDRRNIRPGGRYTLGEIEDAITRRFRVIPRITYTSTRFGRLLHEIRLCFDRALRVIDCRRRCNENLDLTVDYLRDVPDRI